MEAVLNVLSNYTLITVFLVIALGTVFGAIKFGPIQFGAAGALFVGLAIGAFVAPDGTELSLLQNLGLGLFVYLIGLEAGEEFFKDIKSQLGIMGVTLLSIVLGAVVAIGLGAVLNISREVSVGTFAGALTSTPSLSLAQDQTGSELPAVGYSIGYPTGIVIAILLVLLTIRQTWKAKKDQVDADGQVLRVTYIEVKKHVTSDELHEMFPDQFVVGTLRRGHRTVVVGSDYALQPGDRIYVMTAKSIRDEFVEAVGERLPDQRWRNSRLTIQTYSLSNQDIAGNTVGNLPIYRNNSAQILKIRRGDDIILGSRDTYLAAGDLVTVVHPTSRARAIEQYFGNSIQTASELDWVATATGLFVGYLLAVIEIPLPGGSSFALGAAGGPLVIGLILGALQRTGRIAWKLPMSANFSIRQLGLMLFLAAVGIASGPAFASTAFSMDGLKTILLAAVVALIACGSLLLFCWWMGQSESRANGAVSGLLGQPAVLQYTLQNSTDSRIMSGYSATFAIALIFKIVVVPFMFM